MEKPSPETIIGIDLGTTNSCGAVAYGDGQVKLIPHKGGDTTIPSIYAIDDKAKRLIGRAPKDGVVETVQRSVQYRVHAGSDNDVAVDCHGRTFHIHEISSK